jgi:triacylglycerol lipase
VLCFTSQAINPLVPTTHSLRHNRCNTPIPTHSLQSPRSNPLATTPLIPIPSFKMRSIATSLLFTLAAAAPVAKRAVPTYAFAGDAPFSVNAATLAAALTCPGGNPTAAAPPVLLVHGTATTGDQSWGKGYVPALRAEGYTPCYVTLPSRAMDDMQVSSEYVAYNLHYLASLSGGLKLAIISHSQGGPVSQWALQFWPSTRSVTRAFIPLSPDFDGVDLAISELSAVCDLIDCQPSLWQQSQGSNYYKALHAGDFRALVPTTSIWTKVQCLPSSCPR